MLAHSPAPLISQRDSPLRILPELQQSICQSFRLIRFYQKAASGCLHYFDKSSAPRLYDGDPTSKSFQQEQPLGIIINFQVRKER